MTNEKDFQQRKKKSDKESSNTIEPTIKSINKKKIAEVWKKKHLKKFEFVILLSGVVGLFALGVGYYYLERKFKGKIFFVAGVFLLVLGGLLTGLTNVLEISYFFYVLFLFLWVYQLRETILMHNEWNRYISKGVAPW